MATKMPNYTEYTDNYTYLSGSITFSPGGMAGFYQLTQSFIGSLLPPNFLEKGTLLWKENRLVLKDGLSYQDLLKDYWNVIFILVFILALAIFVPIAGLIVCCCRCCGNCGGKTRPSNKRGDLCAKIALAILLTICFGILVFGMAGSFASNQELRKGTNEFPDNGRKIYADVNSYVLSAKDQAVNLLQENYRQFGDAFYDTIQESGKNIVEELSVWESASAMLKIVNFVDTLPVILNNLNNLTNITSNLKSREIDLIEGMEKIKTDLTSTLTNCPEDFSSYCSELNNNISSLAIRVNLTNLPDVSNAVGLIAYLNTDGIKVAAENGKLALENVETKINDILSNILQETSDQINIAGVVIDENLKIMENVVSNLTVTYNNFNSTIEDGYRYLYDYYPYFYYAGLSLSCILLLIAVCLLLGLLLGIFGKRPEKYANNCCTKESGSLCLMSAVVLIFIFTIVFGLVTLVMLIIGISADRGVCYPLRNPNTSTLITLYDQYIENADTMGLDYKISDVLSKCYNNESIYRIFNLENKFNISDLVSKFNITTSLQSILTKLDETWKNIFPENFNILDDASIATLEQLTSVNVNIDIDVFQNELGQSVSNMDLEDVVTSLRNLAEELSIQQPNFSDIIRNNIENIETYNATVLQPTIIDAQEALELATIVDEEMKINSTSFAEAIKQFIEDVKFAQTKLQTSVVDEQAVNSYIEIVQELVYGYLNRVTTVLEDELGRSGALNVAVHSLLIAVCDQITLPWNGVWTSLFICLVTFVPTIILSIWLSSLYKSYKPNARDNERRRSRNNKQIGMKNNDFYEPNRGGRNEDTIPVDFNSYYGGGFNKNKNVDYYQGATAPKVLDYRYNDMAQRLNQYPEQSTRF